jgi:hypothetical protein
VPSDQPPPITTNWGNSVIRAVALLAVILVGLTGCGASSKNQSGDTGGEPGAGIVVSDSPPADLDPSVRDGSSWARGMTYRSRSGIDDDNTHVTGSVFVPKGNPPEGGYPVVALAPETIGTPQPVTSSSTVCGRLKHWRGLAFRTLPPQYIAPPVMRRRIRMPSKTGISILRSTPPTPTSYVRC